MATKPSGDGAVHAYFSPYESPYEAYIAFMHVLSDLERRLSGRRRGPGLAAETPRAAAAVPH